MLATPPSIPQKPPTPMGGGGNAGQSERVRMMLIDVLRRAKQMAEQNGLDFGEILSEVMGSGAGGSVSPVIER